MVLETSISRALEAFNSHQAIPPRSRHGSETSDSGYNGFRLNERKTVSVLMIRAIVQNGLIRPLDPIPAAWAEGHR